MYLHTLVRRVKSPYMYLQSCTHKVAVGIYLPTYQYIYELHFGINFKSLWQLFYLFIARTRYLFMFDLDRETNVSCLTYLKWSSPNALLVSIFRRPGQATYGTILLQSINVRVIYYNIEKCCCYRRSIFKSVVTGLFYRFQRAIPSLFFILFSVFSNIWWD